MDNMLISLVNSLQTANDRGERNRENAGSPKESFAKMLERESRDVISSQRESKAPRSSRTEEFIGKQTPRETKEQQASRAEAQHAADVRLRPTELSSLRNYLYALLHKNPDTLSLRDKAALGLAEHLAALGMTDDELAALLARHGLTLEDLTHQHLETLLQCRSREALDEALTRCAEEHQGKFRGKAATLGAGLAGLAAQQAPGASPQAIPVPGAFQGDAAARAEQRRAVARQIIQHLQLQSLGEGKHQLVLRLNPEYLGALTLVVTGKGHEVSLAFETESHLVKEALQESEQELRGALGAKGLVVQGLTVQIVEDAGA